ncbi:PP2C family protein-serine/threonine phosphatase [Chloroflexus sp.]|uniref:PP2C family protein-serine/threonine phosphatase n=1 Tax=Chloroflexus sp. TaxID=1904827 RepID=UPI002ACE9F70|nr:SpoIIE family protein phosphatase [Chloroflexus sp.]
MAELEMRVAIAKVPRAGEVESGDTLEMIERPGGGFSFVLADGQGSGRSAKTLSHLVATRAIALLKDGARDGAVARAVHDYLYTYRMGQAAATLNILSVDFAAHKILVTRNNPAPFFAITPQGLRSFNAPSAPIGLQPLIRPQISELPVAAYTYVVVFTDGLLRAGERRGEDLGLPNYLAAWPAREGRDPQTLVDSVMQRALELDDGQPSDDMSIVVLAILPRSDAPGLRRLMVSAPIIATGHYEPPDEPEIEE